MSDKNNLPRHVAIIMDGNGRWAKERGLSRTAGHKEGIERVKEIVRAAKELGLEVLTLYAFSAENWNRPKEEVSLLMHYLDNFLNRYIKELDQNNIRLKVIGRQEPIPKKLLLKIRKAEEKTRDNTSLTLVLAFNYGSRQEIVDAAKRLAREAKEGRLDIEGVDADMFGDYLYTAGLPEPDLLIRTSNELRLSNFLLWQLSYAEFYFSKKHWPDFRKDDLLKAVCAYAARERRFGGLTRV